MIYYIADMHFGHTNVLRFDNRPFPDTAQMDDTLIQNWNERVTSEDTVYVLGDAFWKNEENSIQIMERLRGHKHLIQGNHDRVKGKLRPYWEGIEQYAEVNDENRLVILSHYPILFYKNQHYGAVMLYGHVHNTREWELVEKWKKEQWAMGIPSRLIAGLRFIVFLTASNAIHKDGISSLKYGPRGGLRSFARPTHRTSHIDLADCTKSCIRLCVFRGRIGFCEF